MFLKLEVYFFTLFVYSSQLLNKLYEKSFYSDLIPFKLSLSPNYPNRFKPLTKIKYDLPKNSFVDVTVYDMLGNVVNKLVNKNQNSGSNSVKWNATNNQGEPLSPGVYLYKIALQSMHQFAGLME